MARSWRALALVVLAGFAGAVAAQGPTEAEVRAVLERVDRAGQARDVDAIAGALAEGARISITLLAGSTVVDRFSYDKRTYLAALRDGWAQASDYSYRRANQRIVVSGAVATATADVFEHASVPGVVMRTQTRETVTLERVGGSVVITRIVGDASVSAEPR